MAARIVVVGGGVAGAATAFALAIGGADVTVAEARERGQATAAGAGIIAPWPSHSGGDFYRLYQAGAEFYPTLLAGLADAGIDDIGYRRNGALVVDDDPARLDEAERTVRDRIDGGATVGALQRLDPGDPVRLFPALDPALAGLYLPAGARVDGRLLRDGLLAGARRHGARLADGAARLRRERDGRVSVGVGDEVLRPDAVAVAAGAWTNRVLAPLGVALPVEPQRGQITHLSLAGAHTDGWPSVLPAGSHYLVPFDGGRIAVGATRETGSGFDPRVTAAGAREVLDRALAVAPGLSSATVLETRVGLRPLSSSGIPQVGPVPGVTDLYVATGYGPAGLTIGPLAGHLLAALVLGTAAVDQPDLAAFTPSPVPVRPAGDPVPDPGR